MNTEKCFTYSYNVDQLTICTEKGNKSQFDHILESCWEDRLKKNCFRYDLNDVETRRIPGKYGFIAQLNKKRAIERRKPQFMSDIIMPFNPEKFHFGKVDIKEILFELKPLHWSEEDLFGDSSMLSRNALLINVSPLEYCNSLLVPNIDRCFPQVLNLNAIRLALETILMSHNPALKIGMNSLGGYASVNHLHFHLYYLRESLYLESAPMKQLIGDCFELEDFPSEGFAFQLLDKEKVLSTARSIMKLIELFQREKIAHNIFMTRGNAFSSCTSKEEPIFNAIRIFIWGRKSSFGSKNDMTFNPAMCELAGHLLIKERNYYESATEEDIVRTLKCVCHDEYIDVKEKVIQLYT